MFQQKASKICNILILCTKNPAKFFRFFILWNFTLLNLITFLFFVSQSLNMFIFIARAPCYQATQTFFPKNAKQAQNLFSQISFTFKNATKNSILKIIDDDLRLSSVNKKILVIWFHVSNERHKEKKAKSWLKIKMKYSRSLIIGILTLPGFFHNHFRLKMTLIILIFGRNIQLPWFYLGRTCCM